MNKLGMAVHTSFIFFQMHLLNRNINAQRPVSELLINIFAVLWSALWLGYLLDREIA